MDITDEQGTRGCRLRRPRRSLVYILMLLTAIPLLSGCQMSYYLHSAYHQSKLMNNREPLERVLQSEKLSEEDKRKLRLVQKAKAFGESRLDLLPSRNYTTFTQLDDRYVTYIVQAAYAHELKPYLWSFPFVGKVPYKGYFKKRLADQEAAGFDKSKYDTFVRGVSAYSTLGWFRDPVLSSMLRYDDHDLVELILHETIHTTLYIKNAAEFNERLATFLGHEGMKQYYLETEGPDSVHLKKALADTRDQKVFSQFLTREIDALKSWYQAHAGQVTPQAKAERLKEIQARFTREVRPQISADAYIEFEKRELNNAALLAYQTYEYSLDDFAKLFAHFKGDFKKTLAYLKTLDGQDKPDQVLKEFVSKLGPTAG